MQSLSSDIAIELLSFTDLKTIKSLYTVNKFFYKVCSSRKLWYYIYQSKFGKHKKIQGYDHDWCKIFKERQELIRRPYRTTNAYTVHKRRFRDYEEFKFKEACIEDENTVYVLWNVTSPDIEFYGCSSPDTNIEYLKAIYSLDNDVTFTIGSEPFEKEITLPAPVTLGDVLESCSKYYSEHEPQDYVENSREWYNGLEYVSRGKDGKMKAYVYLTTSDD